LSNSLLVGIDVSLKDNKVRILHPDGTSLSKFVVKNSVPGAKSLSQKVVGIAEKNNSQSIVIGLESTSVYGDPLVYFLKQDASSLPGQGFIQPRTLPGKKTGSSTTCS
jgi:transposase